ncbi:MAG: DUF2272 domain-containing protein [Burkholderiaceae bacterium]
MNALHTLALSGTWLLLIGGCAAANPSECNKTSAEGAVRSRIVAAALAEHVTFNGHRIDASGHLWKFGPTETENEPLLDPTTGKPDAHDEQLVAWRRVWEYWLVLDQHVAGIALSRKVNAIPGMHLAGEENAAAGEKTLRELFSVLRQQPSDVNESLRQAAVRAALSDSPWSAAFISYVMHQAGLDDGQFRYAAAHWQYVKQAFSTDARHVYRACDPRLTPPRQGDLLCYSRGMLAPDNFEGWLNAVNLPGFSAASHCEVVVIVDRAASKIETVGGNVLQSVAMRRLKLNRKGVLSSIHYAGERERPLPSTCSQAKRCHQPDLNGHRWSVLLQLR